MPFGSVWTKMITQNIVPFGFLQFHKRTWMDREEWSTTESVLAGFRDIFRWNELELVSAWRGSARLYIRQIVNNPHTVWCLHRNKRDDEPGLLPSVGEGSELSASCAEAG